MIIHEYPKKVLVKIPVSANKFEIIENKLGLFLHFNLDNKQNKIDLNFPCFEGITSKSYITKIAPDKIEIYRTK